MSQGSLVTSNDFTVQSNLDPRLQQAAHCFISTLNAVVEPQPTGKKGKKAKKNQNNQSNQLPFASQGM